MNAVTLFKPPRYRNGDGRSASRGFSPFGSFHRELDQLLDEVFDGFGFTGDHVQSAQWTVVEVHEQEKEFVVTADLPGLEQRDVEVSFQNGIVTLKGERRTEQNGNTLYSDRWSGTFEREITLSPDVDADQISATFKNGVLTVRLPKKPDRLPRRIQIQ
jgi:HSP20 family protein